MFINKIKCLYSNLLMDDETFMITSDVDDIIASTFLRGVSLVSQV
jgi:hypothetical protein